MDSMDPMGLVNIVITLNLLKLVTTVQLAKGRNPFGNCRFPESGIAYGRFKKNWQYDVKVNDSTQLNSTRYPYRIHVCYGNIYHQYTPFMLAYIPAPWILWDMVFYHVLLVSCHVWWSKHVEFMTVEVELLWHVAFQSSLHKSHLSNHDFSCWKPGNLSVSNNMI